MWYKQQLLEVLHKSGAVMKGEFILKSGRTTDVYIDCRRVFLSSHYLSAIVPAYVEVLKHDLNDHTLLCGIPTSGLVLVGGLLQRLAVHRDVRACYLRPETKDHGTKQGYEGEVRPGDKVILLDDVITSGNTVKKALFDLKSRGLEVTRIVVMVNRLLLSPCDDWESSHTGAGPVKTLFGVPFTALLNFNEIV